jgi:hypothetical protein
MVCANMRIFFSSMKAIQTLFYVCVSSPIAGVLVIVAFGPLLRPFLLDFTGNPFVQMFPNSLNNVFTVSRPDVEKLSPGHLARILWPANQTKLSISITLNLNIQMLGLNNF